MNDFLSQSAIGKLVALAESAQLTPSAFLEELIEQAYLAKSESQELLCSISEAAVFCGVSTAAIQDWRVLGRVPASKKGRRYAFHQNDLVQYLKDAKKRGPAYASIAEMRRALAAS